MKLTWKRIQAHTRHVWKIARSGESVTGGHNVERAIVSIEHDGLIGLGEAAPTPYYGQTLDTVERTLGAVEQARGTAGDLLGDDPRDIDGIIDRLLERFDDQRAAVAAIDAALHDWWGRKEGQPVWRLLELDAATTPATSMTLSIDDLALMPQKVEEAKGFHILKMKIGTDKDVETLTRLRELAPTQTIRVDANCGWPAAEAEARCRAVEPFKLELIEQPFKEGELDAVRTLRQVANVPLVADEDSIRPRDVEKLAGVYDGINIKLSKCGGIREALRMVQLARANDLKIMLGCMVETSLGISAAAQLASLVDYVDLDGHLLLVDDPFCGLVLADGVVRPGDEAGLGVRPTGNLTV
ncbi:MAG: dipeptide epimerase [Phycisphaerae bacterium]|nr:dipeptide epimerase [Phycisphaerae bacterium]